MSAAAVTQPPGANDWPPLAFRALCVIVDYAHEKEWVTGNSILCAEMQCSLADARKATKWLRQNGLIRLSAAFGDDGYLVGRGHWPTQDGITAARKGGQP